MFKRLKKSPHSLLFLLVFLATGCAKDLVTGKKSYNWFTLQDDIKLGQQVIDSQMRALKRKDKKVDVDADAEMTSKIRKITGRIAAVSHYPSFPFEAHYADVDVVNAWCAPGGKIMVYSGLFISPSPAKPDAGLNRGENAFSPRYPSSRLARKEEGLVRWESDNELAAVLGHEISHATARHVTEALSRNVTISTLGTVALSAISASGAGTIQNVFGRAVVEGINLYIPFYSRSNEAEADRIGILYTAKAGYNPRAAVDLWYRACQKRGDMYSLYASHPSSCQRAKDLEKHLPEALAEYEKTKDRKK